MPARPKYPQLANLVFLDKVGETLHSRLTRSAMMDGLFRGALTRNGISGSETGPLLEADYFCSDDQGKFTYWSRAS
jgi:hypothetical protein